MSRPVTIGQWSKTLIVSRAPACYCAAAADLKLDLGASWMVGDLVSDVLAGQNAGCRSILLESVQTAPEEAQALAGRF